MQVILPSICKNASITDTGLAPLQRSFRPWAEDLRILLSEMLNQVSDLDAEEVAEVLIAYATPLMDVRAWIVEDEKSLFS